MAKRKRTKYLTHEVKVGVGYWWAKDDHYIDPEDYYIKVCDKEYLEYSAIPRIKKYFNELDKWYNEKGNITLGLYIPGLKKIALDNRYKRKWKPQKLNKIFTYAHNTNQYYKLQIKNGIKAEDIEFE